MKLPLVLTLIGLLASLARAEFGFEPERGFTPVGRGLTHAKARIAEADGVALFVCQRDLYGFDVTTSTDMGDTWGEPTFLDGGSRPDSLETDPVVVLASGGTAVLAYRDRYEDMTVSAIRCFRSTDHGATWSGPTTIAAPEIDGDGTSSAPRIATDGRGNWMIVMTRDTAQGASVPLFSLVSTDDGISWSVPTGIASPGIGGRVELAANDGSWLVVTAGMNSTRSTDLGASWSAPVLVNTSGSVNGLTHTLLPGSPGTWIVSWVRSEGLYSVRSTDDGRTWDTPRPMDLLAPNERHAASPALARNQMGDVLLAWQSYQFLKEFLVFPLPNQFCWVAMGAVSRDEGATWSEPFYLSPDATTEPSLAGHAIWNYDENPRVAGLGASGFMAIWDLRYDVSPLRMTRTLDLDASYEMRTEFGAVPPTDINWDAEADAGMTLGMTAAGLCLTAPLSGEVAGFWSSPGKWLRTVDRTVLRVRSETRTDQELPDSIPLWNIGYDNAIPLGTGGGTVSGGLLSGQFLFLDQAGGASGIGRPQGRSEFEAWIAPLPFLTPQWRGQIAGVAGAFTTENDVWNDIHLTFRAMDFDSGGYGAQFDSGSVCLKRLRVDRYDYSSLGIEPLWAPPISEATHAPQTWPQVLEPGLAWIENGEARYSFPPKPDPPTGATGIQTRKTLLPYDPLRPDWNTRLFPVPWESDTLYMGELDIRAIANDFGPDVIAMHFDVPTWEQIVTHACIRDTSTSPLPSGVAGGPQPYVGFFYSHNATAVDPAVIPDAARVRMLGDFMNSYDIGPVFGLPSSDFAVSRMAISRVVPPARD